MDSPTYVDLNNGEQKNMFFFLLNAYLTSRIETDCESDGDEEVNVYMAGLLHGVVDGKFYTETTDHLAMSPTNVQRKAEDGGSDRSKADVYRANADHRMIAFGLFDGWGERSSRQRLETSQSAGYLEEAQRFYGWASVCCRRMPQKYNMLAQTLDRLANDFETYHGVLDHMARHHLDLLPRLSRGQAFHLEHGAHEAALPAIQEHALDRMLDAYNAWRAEPTTETRAEFMRQSQAYTQLPVGLRCG